MQCLAWDQVCHKCKKKGHFQRLCRSKPVSKGIREVQEDSHDDFMGAMQCTYGHYRLWSHRCSAQSLGDDSELNKQAITFKIYTGADVTVISEADYDEDKDGSLSACNKQLSGPSWEAIDVWGKITKKLYINHKGHLLYPWPACSTTGKASNWSPTTSDISEWDTNRWHHQKIPSTVHWVRKT